MIHPSKVVTKRVRFVIEAAIRICKIKVDTFVYLCRDLGLDASDAKFLIEYYYQLDPGESKSVAFKSPAWGKEGIEQIKLNDEAFDHFSKKENQ